jgi:hypothetical protein
VRYVIYIYDISRLRFKNLIIIQVSPTCKFGGTPDWGGATVPRSLVPRPPVNGISRPPPPPKKKKILGTPLSMSFLLA